MPWRHRRSRIELVIVTDETPELGQRCHRVALSRRPIGSYGKPATGGGQDRSKQEQRGAANTATICVLVEQHVGPRLLHPRLLCPITAKVVNPSRDQFTATRRRSLRLPGSARRTSLANNAPTGGPRASASRYAEVLRLVHGSPTVKAHCTRSSRTCHTSLTGTPRCYRILPVS